MPAWVSSVCTVAAGSYLVSAAQTQAQGRYPLSRSGHASVVLAGHTPLAAPALYRLEPNEKTTHRGLAVDSSLWCLDDSNGFRIL